MLLFAIYKNKSPYTCFAFIKLYTSHEVYLIDDFLKVRGVVKQFVTSV